MKKFLFIIPLTPVSFLNANRRIIQNLCFETLSLQNYEHWTALVIGDELPDLIKENQKFIHVKYEGRKEEKLQIATKFILENNLQAHYIIRLDDDDFFNPDILNEVVNKDFDIYTDKWHTFFEYEYQTTSQHIRLWFPNTCIHKFEHAMAVFGILANEEVKKINNEVRLIENDHSKLHPYYKNKKVIYASRKNPIYLRVLNKESITAKNSLNYEDYLKQFGYWKRVRFKNFEKIYNFKNATTAPKLVYPLKERVYRFLQQLKVNVFYNFFLFKKYR